MTDQPTRLEVTRQSDADKAISVLIGTFERWLEIGSDAQPHYPNGLRPWSNGDLRFLIDGLGDAAAALSTSPQIAGLVSALERIEDTRPATEIIGVPTDPMLLVCKQIARKALATFRGEN